MTDLILPRRAFLAGLAAAMAAPAIVRVDSLMKLPRPERLIWPRDLLHNLELYNGKGYLLHIHYFGGVITLGDEICIPSWGHGKVTAIARA